MAPQFSRNCGQKLRKLQKSVQKFVRATYFSQRAVFASTVLFFILLVFLSRSEAGALFVGGGHNLNRCCVVAYGSILMPFSSFFDIDCSFRCAREFSFSSLGGATIVAKLRSKIAKSGKIRGKVCEYR